jgi:hypothetical protein
VIFISEKSIILESFGEVKQIVVTPTVVAIIVKTANAQTPEKE